MHFTQFILKYEPDSEYPRHYISHNSTSLLQPILAHSFFIIINEVFLRLCSSPPEPKMTLCNNIYTLSTAPGGELTDSIPVLNVKKKT